MKKSQLRKIIRESINEHGGNHIPGAPIDHDQNGLQGYNPPQLPTLHPSRDGSHWYHYTAMICPAKLAMYYTNLPINNIQNLIWINQQYAIAGIAPLPMSGAGHIGGITQFFKCFQVHPSAESWFDPPNNPYTGTVPQATFAALPQIEGFYSNIQTGVSQGWLFGPDGGNPYACTTECNALAVEYEHTLNIDREADHQVDLGQACQEPVGGCPPGPLGVAQMWQGYPVCQCFSPSVGTGTGILSVDVDRERDVTINVNEGCADPTAAPCSSQPPAYQNYINCYEPNHDGCIPQGSTTGIPDDNDNSCCLFEATNDISIDRGDPVDPTWENPCDDWVDTNNCCDFCDSIGWPALAPTNVACGGVGTGGDPNGSNNWFCKCCTVGESLTKDIIPSIDNMMHEASMNILCEREGQDDGEVTNFRITSIGKNGEKGKTIRADKNHEVIRGLDLTNATQGKQLTKGQDPTQEDRLDEGWMCCWLRGGCCEWAHNLPFPHTHGGRNYDGYYVEWDACCGNSGKGGCC